MHFQKENIRINCILPGIVATKIIPREMIAAVSPEWLAYATSPSNYLHGYFGVIKKASLY